MFASNSLLEHLLRGLVGIGAFAIGVSLSAERPIAGTLFILFALVPLRGCPICWSIGLFETARNHFRSKHTLRS